MIKIKIIYNQSENRIVEDIITDKRITISKINNFRKYRDLEPRTAIYLEIGKFDDEDFKSRILLDNKIYIEEIK